MIKLRIDDGIATLWLDRAGAANAIPLAGWRAICRTIEKLHASARVLILRSASDGMFSAGADVTEFTALQSDPAARARFRRQMRGAIEALAALPIPTIAAIDGGCYGAAVALILACDIRIAGADARFATTPAKLGIGYPGEDVARLIARSGRGQASRMLFSAEPIDADEAHRIGLAELRADTAGTAAEALAKRIAANAPGALGLLKRTIADPNDPRHTADFDAAFGGEEFAAAFAAFTSRPR